MKTTTRRCKIVAYYRTSTDDQKLGIEAQHATVARIAEDRGCTIVKSFTEHESGRKCDRVELDKAIRYARRVGAMVVVGKLDRLARNSEFLNKLYNGDVPIVFGDLPEVDGSAAGRMLVQMMAVIAEFEARRMGERMKDVLAVLKSKGTKLGTPENLKHEHQIKGNLASCQKQRARAIEHNADVAAVAIPMRAEGRTLAEIAAHLNENEYLTRNGGSWTPTQVLRVLNRAKGVK